MSKKLAVNLMVLTFCVGSFFGVFIHWLFVDHMPQVRMMEMAKKQQEEMNRMVRFGNVTAVKPTEITVSIERSGDPKVKRGSVVAYKTDNMTTLQEGSNPISKPEQSADLTQYIKPGMHVDVLDKGGMAIAVNWNAQGQGQPVQVGQGQPPAQAGQVQKP